MEKKLPNIFKGIAPKNVNQSTSVINQVSDDIAYNEKSIDNQIRNVFSSEKFVYKADTLITMKDGQTYEKTIIGKTNNSLITLDDELIDVNQIAKIELI